MTDAIATETVDGCVVVTPTGALDVATSPALHTWVHRCLDEGATLLVLDLSCSTFDRAEAFMAEYVAGRFDCLIADVSMPGYSGLDLLRHLRSIGCSMPVIIVTADTRPATRLRAMRGGAHAYLT